VSFSFKIPVLIFILIWTMTSCSLTKYSSITFLLHYVGRKMFGGCCFFK
jgi:hypothetical protein